MKTCTVLTLGPSGAGKSTFINAMGNYVQYETLGDALEDDNPTVLVPVKFLQQRRDANPIEIRMNGKNDHDVKNECSEEAKSCTVNPRVHSFVFGNAMQLNVIDVPGIGDTGGIEVDNRNRSAIMEKLKEFDKIHAIWVFLQASDTRLDDRLLFCLNDVFTVVPKSAIKNITFIITNTRGVDYTRGHTEEPLQAFIRGLNQEHGLNINLDNCSYCVDSEAFRYLVGYHCNSGFRDSQRRLQRNYEESWTESRNSLLKLLKKTFEFEGQNTEKFLTIHEARIAISCFFTTAAKILSIILKSADPGFIEEQKKSLMKGFDIKNDVEVAKTNAPQTICASKKCMKWQTLSNGSKILQSTQICHDNCILKNVKNLKTHQSSLKTCEIFDINNNCRICKCSYKEHMHVYYNFQTIVRKIQLQKQMTNEDIENSIKKRLEQLKVQKNEIYKTIHLAYEYLQQNSIFPFNDRIEEKIKKEIEVQKANSVERSDVIKNLQDLLKKHVEMMKQLEKFKEVKRKNNVSDKEFKSAMEKLFKMPPYGPKIQEIFQTEMNVVNFETADFEPLKVDRLPEFLNYALNSTTPITSKQMKEQCSKFGSFNKKETAEMKVNQEFVTTKNRTENKQMITKPKTYTIIIVGAKGMGKSTFISGIANYLKWPKFADALDQEMEICIPVQFMAMRKDKEPEILRAGFGNDADNENFNDKGESVTQKPQVHCFDYGEDTTIRVIDTPGLEDTRGADQDEKNLKLIQEVIEEQDEIHAICIVLKSTEKKLTPEFEMTVRQLLSLFPKTALKNVFFIFTFSMGTYFGVGDVMSPLKALQTRIENSHGKTFDVDQNLYCIDSESFRYLLCRERGILWGKTPEMKFEFAWEQSSAQIKEFFENLLKIQPIKKDEIVACHHLRELFENVKEQLKAIPENEAAEYSNYFEQLKFFVKKYAMTLSQ
uniref:G domain-containing protein n=1 Tax=Panagrolaimus sp. JU765 TaxID=591449 RepID=A0AC34RDY1_9BILA